MLLSNLLESPMFVLGLNLPKLNLIEQCTKILKQPLKSENLLLYLMYDTKVFEDISILGFLVLWKVLKHFKFLL